MKENVRIYKRALYFVSDLDNVIVFLHITQLSSNSDPELCKNINRVSRSLTKYGTLSWVRTFSFCNLIKMLQKSTAQKNNSKNTLSSPKQNSFRNKNSLQCFRKSPLIQTSHYCSIFLPLYI
jgi:hypothetical protein